MLKVSEEVVALRSESNRGLPQELLQGAALKSQAGKWRPPRKYDAKPSSFSHARLFAAHDEFNPRDAVAPNDAACVHCQCLTLSRGLGNTPSDCQGPRDITLISKAIAPSPT